jgi:hypothetical protein
MCESCGANYRKYGVISFVKAEDSKKPDKKDSKKKGFGGAGGTGVADPLPVASA